MAAQLDLIDADQRLSSPSESPAHLTAQLDETHSGNNNAHSAFATYSIVVQ